MWERGGDNGPLGPPRPNEVLRLDMSPFVELGLVGEVGFLGLWSAAAVGVVEVVELATCERRGD